MKHQVEHMEFSSIKYVADANSVQLSLTNGSYAFLPMDPRNRHYKEILRQTKSGKLKIEGGE